MSHYVYLFLVSYGVCYVLIDSYIFTYFRDLILYKKHIVKNEEEESFIEALKPRSVVLLELFNCYFCLGFWVGLFIYVIDCGFTFEIFPKAIANSAALYLVHNFVFKDEPEDPNYE